MKKNLVLALPQVTVDYTFKVPGHIEEICNVFVSRNYFSKEHHADLTGIARSGLQRDLKLALDPGELEHFGLALDYVRGEYPHLQQEQIGGNPGIFALRGYYLDPEGRDPSLPTVQYIGLRPESYIEFESRKIIEDPPFHKVLQRVFNENYCVTIRKKPITMSLEGNFKIIFVNGIGRTLDELRGKDGSFSAYVDRLERLSAEHVEARILFAFPAVPYSRDAEAKRLKDEAQGLKDEAQGLDAEAKRLDTEATRQEAEAKRQKAGAKRKEAEAKRLDAEAKRLEDGAALLKEIKDRFQDRALFFFGSSSFRDGTVLNVDRARFTWVKLLQGAHILSMNETELADLHTAVVGNGTFQEKALSYKLMELPIEAIKVCHSSAGSLMDPGPDPGRFLNAQLFAKDPSAFLENSLWLATDGAAYGIASQFGNQATEAAVRIFSVRVKSRNTGTFRAVFLNVLERMPPGLIAVPAPMVARGHSKSALTGVGARFDGLLATFLMRS
jgi:hypothetical protein